MTIIEPRRQVRHWNLPLIASSALLTASAVVGIFLYNRNVNLRHEIGVQSALIETVRATNADYKNKFYQAFDSKKVASFAVERQLAKEKHPAYLEMHALLAHN